MLRLFRFEAVNDCRTVTAVFPIQLICHPIYFSFVDLDFILLSARLVNTYLIINISIKHLKTTRRYSIEFLRTEMTTDP